MQMRKINREKGYSFVRERLLRRLLRLLKYCIAGDGHLLGNGRRPSGPRFPNESLRKEDLSSKIDLVIAWLSDLKTKIENLNFVAKGLERNVTCLEEEVA